MSDQDECMISAVVSEMLREDCCFAVPRTERFSISPEAADEIRAGLHRRIRKIAAPSLSGLFLEYLNDTDMLDCYLEDSGADAIGECREAFARRMTASGCAALKARLPALFAYVHRAAAQYDAFIRELLQRMDVSYDEICSGLLGGRPFGRLTGLTADSGDSHNHGRSTAILTTDSGKFVYKPHDVRIDRFFSELVARFFADVMRSPAVCVCDGYGFTEYIPNSPADTPEAAARFFYNLGGLAAVVQMLGSADLHHSNVLAAGVFPVIIDCELLVLPGSRVSEKSLAGALQFSLLNSSLMPSRRGETELSILFARDEGNRAAPVVDGIRRNITDDPASFFRGFRDIYLRCMEKREEIRAFVSSWKGIFVRHIYRSSAIYGELLNHTWEASWMADEHLPEVLFDRLSVAMKRSGSATADKITASEVSAVLRGDIPYFCSRTDSCDLFADGEVVFPGFFHTSSIDHLLSRIAYLSEEDMAFEETLLRKAMTRVVEHRSDLPVLALPVTGGKEPDRERLIRHAEQIFRLLADDAVCTPSGELCWFGPDYFLQTGMDPLRSGLVAGTAGLALFFAALQRLSEDRQVKAEAARLLQGITDRLESMTDSLCALAVIHPNTEDVSLSSGLTGKLLSARLIGSYLQDGRYAQLCRRMLSVLRKIDLDYEGVDLFTGLSGLLKLLCRTDDFFSEPGIPELCTRLADRIAASADLPWQGKRLWKTLSPEWALSGAGHGQSGVASALWLAGQRLNRPDLTECAMAGFRFEEEIYSETLGAWPDRRAAERTEQYLTGYCSGAPGIGLNALLLNYENAGLTFRRAVDSCLKEPLLPKDFLCCGNCAVVDFLLEAGLKTKDERLLKAAKDRMAAVIERAGRNGTYLCLPRTMKPIFSPSLFYGVAGIGYEMLRLAAPDIIESALL